jgi:DNA repair exonuclease SbcCD ATPase subunit
MPRKRSAQPRYRRRVVLELTPDESTILDALADRHGTLRGAVLAGLRELEANRSAELEAHVTDLRKRLESAEQDAQAGSDQAAAGVAAINEQLATSRKELKVAQAERKAVREDLRSARARLSNARDAAETQRRALEARLVHHAYCGSCGKLVPESEWAEQAGQGGVLTYHKPDGFRTKSGLRQQSSILFWRPSPSGESKP